MAVVIYTGNCSLSHSIALDGDDTLVARPDRFYPGVIFSCSCLKAF